MAAKKNNLVEIDRSVLVQLALLAKRDEVRRRREFLDKPTPERKHAWSRSLRLAELVKNA